MSGNNMRVVGEVIHDVRSDGDIVRHIQQTRELRFLSNGEVWAYERIRTHTYRQDLSGGEISERISNICVQQSNQTRIPANQN